jgi:hypothetical protein
MSRLFLFFCLYLSIACNSVDSDSKHFSEASLVSAEKIMTAEERALENKIANRTLLQKIVDDSEKFQKTDFSFSCNSNAGGILTKIMDDKVLKGFRFASSDLNGSEFISLYYIKNELVFAVHEKGDWLGNKEKVCQTIFYLDKQIVIRCLSKNVNATDSRIEKLIFEADFEEIISDTQLLDRINLYEDVFINNVTKNNIAEFFCN